jgi:hypothetical protein
MIVNLDVVGIVRGASGVNSRINAISGRGTKVIDSKGINVVAGRGTSVVHGGRAAVIESKGASIDSDNTNIFCSTSTA